MATTFFWYELMTSNLDAAEKFYPAVVGWTTQEFPGQDMRYLVVEANGVGVGGMMTIPPEAAQMGAPPAWVGYVKSGDIGGDTEAVKNAGGQVYRPPTPIPGVDPHRQSRRNRLPGHRTAGRSGLRRSPSIPMLTRGAACGELADEAYAIGPAPASRELSARASASSRRRRTGAEAIHPGYGFLSENPASRSCGEGGADVDRAAGRRRSAPWA
jgi:predicted enzyme related to lactoylglutathione lyase